MAEIHFSAWLVEAWGIPNKSRHSDRSDRNDIVNQKSDSGDYYNTE